MNVIFWACPPHSAGVGPFRGSLFAPSSPGPNESRPGSGLLDTLGSSTLQGLSRQGGTPHAKASFPIVKRNSFTAISRFVALAQSEW
jgi:hypothetical protein